MPMTQRPARLAAILALSLIAPALARGDDPPTQPPIPQPARPEDRLKPLPPFEIPDDPPPYEGAMITMPYIIEPPDIIVVELLEALPGRPITGERLVKSDGRIGLGFYGEVEVAGLTTTQAKVKIINHMKIHLNDEVLGLVRSTPVGPPADAGEMDPSLPPVPRSAFDEFKEEIRPPGAAPGKSPDPPGSQPELPPTPPAEQSVAPKPASFRPPAGRRSTGLTFTSSRQGKGPFNNRPDPAAPLNAPHPKVREFAPTTTPEPVVMPNQAVPPEPAGMPGHQVEVIDPEDSNRVFVDVTMFNTKVYYVVGDIANPGRLPFTGRETILDALNYAGGLTATADEGNIHLRRPARGSKPARDYKIDLEAIHNGDSKANLQLFPGDRLVVGRNAIVKTTAELDRMASPFNSIYNQMLQYSFALRAMATARAPLNNSIQIKIGGQTYTLAAGEPATLSVPQRDAIMKEWLDLWWSTATKGGPKLDDKALRDAIIRGLNPPKEPDKK